MKPGLAAIGAAIVLATGSPAAASPRAIIVESHVGARPEGAADLMAPVITALGEHGAVGGTALRQLIDKQSAPAALVTAEHLTTAERLVTQAEALIAHGRQAEALRLLPPALDVYRAQAAAVAGDPALRELEYRALVALITAQLAVGNNEQAFETMEDLWRSFPERQPKAPLANLAVQVGRKFAAAIRQGTLVIDGGDGIDLFANERKLGTGHVKEVLPIGTYRVLARSGNRASRVHTVTITSGKATTVTIDFALESALVTNGDFVGFLSPDDAQRQSRETDLARRLGRALGAGQVIVLGLRGDAGARQITAATISVDSGKLLLAASIPAEPLAQLPARATALADYFAGQPPRDGVAPIGEVKGAGRATIQISTHPEERANRRHLYLGGAITGLAAIGAGAVLVWYDGRSNCRKIPGQVQCPRVYDTGLAGWLTIGTGAALTAAASYLWYRARPASAPRALGLAPSATGLTVTFSSRF